MSGTLRTLNGLFVGVLFIFVVYVLKSCRANKRMVVEVDLCNFILSVCNGTKRKLVFQETTILI